MKYVVIGGVGAMGRIVVRDLFEFAQPSDSIVVADFNEDAARLLAVGLRDPKVKAAKVDARNVGSTAKLLKGAFVAINCVQHHLNLLVMEAALHASTHYIDLGGLFHMTLQQLRLHRAFQQKGRLAIVGMGAAPGITNLLAQLGAKQLDRVREIHCRVASVDRTRYKNPPALPLTYSLITILEEFSTPPAVFRHGKLRFVEPMSGMSRLRFPAPVGVQLPMYTIHSELATLPQSFADKGVREVSFKIAFPSLFVERVRFLRDLGLASANPIQIAGAGVSPVELVSRVAMAQPAAKVVGKLKQHEIVRTILKGLVAGRKVTLILDCHTAGAAAWGLGTDINTGVPPALVARMLAAGEIQQTGVLPPEKAVVAERFFELLNKRGLWLRRRMVSGWQLKT